MTEEQANQKSEMNDDAASGQGVETGPEASADSSDSPLDLVAELADAEGRAMRAQAELENFRKRMRREMEDSQKYAAIPVLRELLPVVDDMQRAIAAAEKSEDSTGLLAGVKMVEARLQSVLQQQGCQQIEATGTAFDPARHEAILMQPTSDHESGQVMQVTQQGYQVHDRVIRPAQVIVAKAIDESPSE